MRTRTLSLLGILGITITVLACQPPSTPTPIDINIFNNQQQGQGGNASATPSSCPNVAVIGMSARLTDDSAQLVTSVARGGVVQLDATPKDSSGTPVPSVCHSPVIAWGLSGPCSLDGNTTGFNPRLKGGSSAGICVVTATVGDKTGTLSLSVQ